MTMDENVAKAVERADLAVSVGMTASLKDWQTIRARMVELEAENERLRERAEKAKALLSEAWGFLSNESIDWVDAKDGSLLDRITAHLSENERLRKIEEERWSVVATRNAAVMRAERAEALLRECFSGDSDAEQYFGIGLFNRITAHLSENGHG